MADETTGLRVTVRDWGKDHWSTLLFVETRVVDHGGIILKNDPHLRGHRPKDLEQYPTRLRGGVNLYGHGDWDCIMDMVAEGVVTQDGAEFQLTDSGWIMAGRLRRWKAEGRGIGNFGKESSDYTD